MTEFWKRAVSFDHSRLIVGQHSLPSDHLLAADVESASALARCKVEIVYHGAKAEGPRCHKMSHTAIYDTFSFSMFHGTPLLADVAILMFVSIVLTAAL